MRMCRHIKKRPKDGSFAVDVEVGPSDSGSVRSDIKIFDFECVVFDVLSSRLDMFAHQK